MSRDVTIVYVTYRPDPKFDWFADSVARQIDGGDADVVIVDGAWTPERTAWFEAQARGRFAVRHVPAKPTPYAGPHRLTKRDYFTAASARNTGIVHATAPYLVFADDLSIVMPGWWEEVLRAKRAGEVVAGAYQKHRRMDVQEGRLVSSESTESGIDTRWWQGSDEGPVPIGGGQLYGCSFGAPRELLLAVGGYDELCDTIGGEDLHLGVRLEWAGATIRYSRRMLTIESEELHGTGTPAIRCDKEVPPSLYIRRLREFGIGERCVQGKWDSSHMVLDILFGTRSTQPQGNYYLLSSLRPEALDTTVKRFPRVHWFDRQPLSEL